MDNQDTAGAAPAAELEAGRALAQTIRAEIGKVIVGQQTVVEEVMLAVMAGGHVLLEGVPGVGKTLLVRSLAAALDLRFARIQFTPDLMPADIVGTQILIEGDGRRALEFRRGPVFANVVLADEINRATPKTQSAMLEAMQEGSVTAGGSTMALPRPFFVLATQNPIEMEGTFPLPEAQLDRFLLQVRVPFPPLAELDEIVERTTGVQSATCSAIANGEQLLALQHLVRRILVARPVRSFALRLVLATHPDTKDTSELSRRFVRYGASPRGAQALMLAARARALLQGRANASFDDVRAVAPAALRHRVLLNFEGEAEGYDSDRLVRQLLDEVPQELAAAAAGARSR